ncbi:hypothetical protein TIFTF001_013192 [Ficus carica]|uniref:Uncharacterized protein n=1 Tax=Ficus carica TaxID=3494 RepID=A0AA88D5S9_FICCA|nr:hypothetical protein TIFTF001_013192 [Ficus carica]
MGGSGGWGWGPWVGGGGREGKREAGEERKGGRQRPAGQGWDRWWGGRRWVAGVGGEEKREKGEERGEER